MPGDGRPPGKTRKGRPVTDEQRISQARQRIRDHEAKVQQLQGRKQSLQEQRGRYDEELAKAGLTVAELPAQITTLEQAAGATLAELEATLDSVGA